MKFEASSSQIAPPVFDGENYRFWTVKMETCQEALDLWKAMEEDYEVPSLPNNPTVAQSRSHTERKTRKSKAIASLFDVVSQPFSRESCLSKQLKKFGLFEGRTCRR